jgi:iron complex transport system substrate-binding protein
MSKNATNSPRVASLIASATEILHALGAGKSQVARSHECDYPSSVKNLPSITRPKFKVEGSSADVDKAVRDLVERGLAVYEVNSDAMAKLKPNVILTQDQCEVCAVSLADVERAVCSLMGNEPHIVSLRPHTLSDVYRDIHRVADAIGRPEAGTDLVSSMQARFKTISEAVEGMPRKRLAFIEWMDPPMSGGHWMPELTEIAGGISVFGTTGEPSPWITWKEVAKADPDAIIIAPCGYDIATTRREVRPLVRHSEWQELGAVRNGQVFLADGNAYFNRPGPRLVESAEIIAEILHPDACDYGLRGKGYVAYELNAPGKIAKTAATA